MVHVNILLEGTNALMEFPFLIVPHVIEFPNQSLVIDTDT